MPLSSLIVLTIIYYYNVLFDLLNFLTIEHKYMPVGAVYSVNSYVFMFIMLRLTFLLQYLEPLLGLSVQVLQVLRPAALNENILLVVLGGPVVDGQPLLVFIPFRASCSNDRENRRQMLLSYSIKHNLLFVIYCRACASRRIVVISL